MDTKVIRWKLNELMARKRIRNKDLAKELGVTETSIYRLRKTDEMPRLSPERLNGLCTSLNCQPGELLEWIPDPDFDSSQVSPDASPPQSQITLKEGNISRSSRPPMSCAHLNVGPELERLESA